MTSPTPCDDRSDDFPCDRGGPSRGTFPSPLQVLVGVLMGGTIQFAQAWGFMLVVEVLMMASADSLHARRGREILSSSA